MQTGVFLDNDTDVPQMILLTIKDTADGQRKKTLQRHHCNQEFEKIINYFTPCAFDTCVSLQIDTHPKKAYLT